MNARITRLSGLRLLPLALLLVIAAGCGQEQAQPAGSQRAVEAQPASADQLEPELWARLTAELDRVLKEEGRDRSTSAVSAGAGSAVGDLELYSKEGVGNTLVWSYRNQGDYDLNGLVTISDLTQVGVHFGRRFGEDGWKQAQLADGDRNGEVNIGDVTPIGQNFGGRVDGFELQDRSTFVFPQPQNFAFVQHYPFIPGDPSSGEYPVYEKEFGAMLADPDYRVVPYIEEDGNYSYGPPSNIVSTTAGWDPWPTSGANNSRSNRSRSLGPFAATASVVWSLELLGNSSIFCSPVCDDNGNIYVGTALSTDAEDPEGHIQCVGADGTLRWRYACRAPLMTPAVGYRGSLIFGGFDGKVFSLSADGVMLWESQVVGAAVFSSALVDIGGNISLSTLDIAGQSGQGTLYHLLADGSIDWSRTVPDSLIGPPLFDGDGRIVAIDSQENFYFYLDDGTLDATMSPNASLDYLQHAMISGNTLVMSASTDNALLFVPPALPSFEAPLPADPATGLAVNSDGNVILGVRDDASNSSELLLLDLNGNVIWSVPVGGDIIGDIVVDRENRMYFGRTVGEQVEASDFFFRCVDEDQTLRWELELDGVAIYPILAGEGRLVLPLFPKDFLGEGNQTLIAIEED